MKNKKFLEIVFLSIFVIGLSALTISSIIKTKVQKITREETNIKTTQNEGEKGKILLKVNKRDSDINLTISPPKDPIYLRAFAIKVSILTEGKMPKIDNENFIDSNFSAQGSWLFPIQKLTFDSKTNSINIDLSGFVISNPFYLEEEIPMVSIKLPQNSSQGFTIKSFSLDNEVTRFLDNSVESIPYQTNPEGE